MYFEDIVVYFVVYFVGLDQIISCEYLFCFSFLVFFFFFFFFFFHQNLFVGFHWTPFL